MSDSFSSDESTPQRIVAVPPNGPPTALRWFFVVNGLVCSLLIGAWVAFGMRGRGESSDGESEPFASATDDIEEEDDNNGRPKVVKIEMKWSDEGIRDFELTERSGRVVHKADLIGLNTLIFHQFMNDQVLITVLAGQGEYFAPQISQAPCREILSHHHR